MRTIFGVIAAIAIVMAGIGSTLATECKVCQKDNGFNLAESTLSSSIIAGFPANMWTESCGCTVKKGIRHCTSRTCSQSCKNTKVCTQRGKKGVCVAWGYQKVCTTSCSSCR